MLQQLRRLHRESLRCKDISRLHDIRAETENLFMEAYAEGPVFSPGEVRTVLMDICDCGATMVVNTEEGLYICETCHMTRRFITAVADHKDTELHAQDAFLNHALRTKK